MDESAANMKGEEAKKPEHEENDDNSPKHFEWSPVIGAGLWESAAAFPDVFRAFVMVSCRVE